MKSCIVVPPSDFLDSDKVFPHLGPLYIKRFVEERSDHIVDVLDEEPFNVEDYEVVGFSCTTPQYNYALNMLPLRAKTVIGGPHCKFYGVQNHGWNYVIKGDGCYPFLDILNGNEPIERNDDKDIIPHRDKSLLKYKYYLNGKPTTVIITARGCPNSCRFCEHASTKVKLNSINWIVFSFNIFNKIVWI